MPAPHDDELATADTFMEWVRCHHPDEPEYHQAVAALVEHVLPDVRECEAFRRARVLQRLTEPDRVITFRVVWERDDGRLEINRGYRVQHTNALGPYKGGLRFVPSLSCSVLKFLAFEQTFKNSLTGLSLGAAKGGADFESRRCSEREVARFCRAYMTELFRHIGPETDVPAGDIGVGQREIGYLFGQYRRLENRFVGALTGKGTGYGGSELRTEATGWGAVYFLCAMLEDDGESLDGRRITVSGAGNVATHVAAKAAELGARVLTLSNRDGYLHAGDGLTDEQIHQVAELRAAGGTAMDEIAERVGADWHAGAKPWEVPCDVAVPAATQNELDGDDASALLDNGCRIVVEAANMPLTASAARALREGRARIAPGKAANAGGVAVSSYEMLQNRLGLSWRPDRIDSELREVMRGIHARVKARADGEDGHVDLERGADRAGFERVAKAIVAMGAV